MCLRAPQLRALSAIELTSHDVNIWKPGQGLARGRSRTSKTIIILYIISGKLVDKATCARAGFLDDQDESFWDFLNISDTLSWPPSPQTFLTLHLPEIMDEINGHSPPDYNTIDGFLNDIRLVFRLLRFLPHLFFPLYPFRSAKLDELFPSSANLREIFLHFMYIIFQLAFLITLPLFPIPFTIVYAAAFVDINKTLCMLTLNGGTPFITSNVDISDLPRHDNERWIFFNGIGVGYVIALSMINIVSSFSRSVTTGSKATSIYWLKHSGVRSSVSTVQRKPVLPMSHKISTADTIIIFSAMGSYSISSNASSGATSHTRHNKHKMATHSSNVP